MLIKEQKSFIVFPEINQDADMVEEKLGVFWVVFWHVLDSPFVLFKYLFCGFPLAVEMIRNSKCAPRLSHIGAIFEEDLAGFNKGIEMSKLHLHVGCVAKDIEIVLGSMLSKIRPDK